MASLVSACGNQTTEEWGAQVVPIDVEQLVSRAARIKVFFNHQSVGENILLGVDGLVRGTGAVWTVVKMKQGPWPGEPGLLHASLGENENPKSKMDAFGEALRSWSGEKPAVAMLKLCFVDVTASTDISKLLGYYQGTVNRLKSEFPTIVFGHVTVPLAREPDSLRVKIKRMLGRRVSEDSANLARTKYNQKLREMFPNDPVFDLEEIESTRPDGTRVWQRVAGERAYGLASEYASDSWGHLNERGARLAAIGLARFIAEAAARRPATPR